MSVDKIIEGIIISVFGSLFSGIGINFPMLDLITAHNYKLCPYNFYVASHKSELV